jgi:hypothetical protein
MNIRVTAAMGMVCLFFTGCAIQRAQVAKDAQSNMIGLTKGEVLACMGPPIQKVAEQGTEVWAYGSGDGRVTVSTFASANGSAQVTGGPGYAHVTGSSFGSSTGVASRRFCAINVVMQNDRVSKVNYSGPTGGLVTEGEQCAYAVKNCVRQ